MTKVPHACVAVNINECFLWRESSVRLEIRLRPGVVVADIVAFFIFCEEIGQQ